MPSHLEPGRVNPAVHRRRRAVALLALATVVGLVALIASLGFSSGDKGSRPRPAATLPRVKKLPPSAQALRRRALAREARAIERVRRRMPFVISGGRRRLVALTFDDGPGPFTPQVIGALRRAKAPATFFAVGQMMRYFHASVTKELDDHYPVENHTQNHPLMGLLPLAAQRAQILQGTASLRPYGVPEPHLYRPPYRSISAATFKVLRQLKLLMVLWSVDSEDYRQPGVARIVANVMGAVKPGGIVLMHDGGGQRTQTIAAIPFIVRQLRRRGYRLVTVPELLRTDPPARHQKLGGVSGG